uniref:Uncharacterized protein n=1 Tax=viral metagenome TaxID=1070528 RepID=A0A6C0HI31_9ZZZZ
MANFIMTILSSLTSKIFSHKYHHVSSYPEFFAQYTVGTSVYNTSRPNESYVIYQLFVDHDNPDGPYVVALLKATKNTSNCLRKGTMLLTRMASADKQFYLPCK